MIYDLRIRDNVKIQMSKFKLNPNTLMSKFKKS